MKNENETMPIPSGWRFLSETELVRGSFKIDCVASNCVHNESSISYNENLELVKSDIIQAGHWYFDTERDGFFCSNPTYTDWVSLFTRNDNKVEFTKSVKSFWKVVKKKPMKENKDGSMEYGKSNRMSAESIKNEITIHEARINELKKSLEDLKPKRFLLPVWIKCDPNYDHTKQASIIVGDYMFCAWQGGWIKVHGGREQGSFELEETTFDKLVVGDWFMSNINAVSIFGITERTESFDIEGVEVFNDGRCRDLNGSFVDEKYYKIVPKN